MKDGFLAPEEVIVEELPEPVEPDETEGTVITPLPPELITPQEGVISPKSPDEVDRELESKARKVRQKLGL